MTQLDNDFSAMIKQAGALQGLDSLTSEIFARVFLSPDPIAMDEIAKKTGYSLASVSNKVKLFLQTGMMAKVKKPGTKRIFLYMEKDMLRIMKDTMMKKEKAFVSVILADLPKIIKKHSGKDTAERTVEKVAILKKYHKQMSAFRDILKKMMKELDEL